MFLAIKRLLALFSSDKNGKNEGRDQGKKSTYIFFKDVL